MKKGIFFARAVNNNKFSKQFGGDVDMFEMSLADDDFTWVLMLPFGEVPINEQFLVTRSMILVPMDASCRGYERERYARERIWCCTSMLSRPTSGPTIVPPRRTSKTTQPEMRYSVQKVWWVLGGSGFPNLGNVRSYMVLYMSHDVRRIEARESILPFLRLNMMELPNFGTPKS
eukprot:1860554-Amphidinium_carterae.1